MKATTKAASIVLLAAGALTLTACSSTSSKHAGDIGSIRSNPSPAMQSLARRGDDISNTHTRTYDTNLRAMQGDIDRLILFNDRPSRLHNNVKP